MPVAAAAGNNVSSAVFSPFVFSFFPPRPVVKRGLCEQNVSLKTKSEIEIAARVYTIHVYLYIVRAVGCR